MDLMSAMPAAAAVPASNIDGICQNGGAAPLAQACAKNQSKECQDWSVREDADTHKTESAPDTGKCGMVKPFLCAIRMPPDQYDRQQTEYIWHS
jgi:hypothetical protein